MNRRELVMLAIGIVVGAILTLGPTLAIILTKTSHVTIQHKAGGWRAGFPD